jgi:hypothetical protein
MSTTIQQQQKHWSKEKYTAVSKYGNEHGLNYVTLVQYLGEGLDVENTQVKTDGKDLVLKYPCGETVRVLNAAKIRPTLVKMLSKMVGKE